MKRVVSFDMLGELVAERKSVIVPRGNNRPIPAAWAWQMPVGTVYGMIKKGMFIYEPKKKNGSEKEVNEVRCMWRDRQEQ